MDLADIPYSHVIDGLGDSFILSIDDHVKIITSRHELFSTVKLHFEISWPIIVEILAGDFYVPWE